MAIVLPNEGKLELLEKMLRDALSTDDDYVLKLYNNDYTPVDGTTSSDFDEATFTDYTSKTLTRSSWSAATIVGGKAQSTYGTPQTWVVGTVGDTIYGYWIEGATSGAVLWAEKLNTARIVQEDDIINLTPVFTLDTE